MANKERAQSPEHRAAISAAKRAAGERDFRMRSHLITEREKAVQAPTFTARFGNSGVAKAMEWVNAERCTAKINPDGSRMSLKDEIAFRERTGYGKEDTIAGLKAKLEGKKESKEATLSDAELLKLTEGNQPAAAPKPGKVAA